MLQSGEQSSSRIKHAFIMKPFKCYVATGTNRAWPHEGFPLFCFTLFGKASNFTNHFRTVNTHLANTSRHRWVSPGYGRDWTRYKPNIDQPLVFSTRGMEHNYNEYTNTTLVPPDDRHDRRPTNSSWSDSWWPMCQELPSGRSGESFWVKNLGGRLTLLSVLGNIADTLV